MAYATRTKDDPGDVGRAADQQQSIDNEEALYAAVLGSASAPGIVKGFVQEIEIADNVATEVFTITTTNETGSNDGGSYMCVFEGIAVHEGDEDGDNAVIGGKYAFVRGVDQAGAGTCSAVVEVFETAVGASDAAAKTVSAVTVTVAETSEYIMSVKFQVNIAGTATTDVSVSGMVTVYYDSFLTPPIITSAS